VVSSHKPSSLSCELSSQTTFNNNMDSTTTITADAILTNVLPDIKNYLDVESTVQLSQTCRSLHGLLTEDSGGLYPKIKQSYFTFGDPSLWRDDITGRRVDRTLVENTKMKSLAIEAVTKVHFPSLKRIEFRLSPGKTFTNREGELRDAFVYMTMGLGTATELEEFYIDCGHFMKFDTFNSKMVYEVFATSLASCKKLKKIKIFNHYQQGGQSRYSIGFLHSLIAMMKERVLTLEEVTLLIGNRPMKAPITKAYETAAYDLFMAILKLQRLRDLSLQFNLESSPLLNIFIQASQHVLNTFGKLPSEAIRKFMITCVLYKANEGQANPLPTPLSLSPCIALLGDSPNLHTFVIRVPPTCWDNSCEDALKDLLTDKPKMRQLGLYFNSYRSVHGHCFDYILKYIKEREQYTDNLIIISGIDCDGLKDDAEKGLNSYFNKEGKKCLTRDDKGIFFQAWGKMIPRCPDNNVGQEMIMS